MPRYVILRHETPLGSPRPSHWDFMLEQGDVLRTWAIELSPDEAAPQPALLLPDHRAAYLTYEGPVSNNRGEVSRWDEGTFAALSDVAGDHLELELNGRRMRGRVSLIKRVETATNDEPIFDFRYRAG